MSNRFKEHPEDKANRLRCEAFVKSAEGRALAAKIIDVEELWALVLTYGDREAELQFDKLREAFWSRPEIP